MKNELTLKDFLPWISKEQDRELEKRNDRWYFIKDKTNASNTSNKT